MNNVTDSATPREKLGVKETTDVLKAANELAIFLIGILKDGFQVVGDFKAIFDELRNNEDFRNKLQDAYKGIQSVPAEIKDLDAAEGVQLAGVQIGYLPRILDALKAK